MRYSVATFRGDSRLYVRFAIFAVVTLVVALTITGCAGAVGASQPSTATKSSPTSITTTALATGTMNVQYSATFTAQGGVLPYTWHITSGTLPAGIALTSSTGTLAGIPTVAGTASFTVKVTDSSATRQTSSESFTLTIEQPEAALAITTTSLPAGGMRSNYNATLQATGGTIPYTWSISSGAIPTGLTLGAAGVISGTPATAGTFSFVAEVADSASPKHTTTKSLSVEISAAAAALEITTTSLAAGKDDTAYSTTLSAIGGKTPYTWSVASGTLPAGLTLASNGAISGTPSKTGTSSFNAEVRDSSSPQQTATRAMLLTVAGATPAAAPLSITTAALTAGKQESAYTQGLGATGGKAPYTWNVAAGSLPSGLTMTTGGMISGTPTAAGSFVITAEVRDDSTPAQTAEKTYILTVSAVTAAPPLSITTTSLAEATENLVYSATLTATGGTKPYTWTKAGGSLPAGVTLGSSGILTGAPTASGSFEFLVEVLDTSNPEQIASEYLTLVVAAPTSTLSITTTSVANGTVNSSYISSLGASGGLTPYAWSLSSGALPTGVTLSSTGVISGTPKTSGTYTIVPKVTDSAATPQTATKQFTFTVSAAVSTLAISTSSVPAGKVGTAYATTLAATGGTTPYSWSLAGGALPSGVSISSAGTISGTPTASGSFTFVAQVTDSGSPAQTAQMTYSLSVSATTTSPVSITTASLAAGKVGTAYA
ncbi:MAG: putative Ig domain-containing protein, partial [Candidatus Acidiferrales bacterium]